MSAVFMIQTYRLKVDELIEGPFIVVTKDQIKDVQPSNFHQNYKTLELFTSEDKYIVKKHDLEMAWKFPK